jgi:aldose 1-epimerase
MTAKSILSAVALTLAVHAPVTTLAEASKKAEPKSGPSIAGTVAQSVFGALADGRKVTLYTLQSPSGAQVKIINYGAIVVSLTVPDRQGKARDVVLGYDSLEGYVHDKDFFGATVGRYGNRIAAGKFTLDGKNYQLNLNNGPNHLHGGAEGFYKKLWKGEPVNRKDGQGVKLTYVSPDGEEGYPGTLTLTVTYTLTHDNGLRIDYQATTDKATILNPTHHSYFNLSGDPTRTILDEELTIDADKTTPVGPGLIPTGKLADVGGTPMDFRKATRIGARVEAKDEQLELGKGYDHNWVLRRHSKNVRKVAELYDPTSGIVMQILTDQPGLQFYSGNFLNGTIHGKNGVAYQHRTAVCLEAQLFPDSPNHPTFPSAVLRPGHTYTQTSIYQFSTRATGAAP